MLEGAHFDTFDVPEGSLDLGCSAGWPGGGEVHEEPTWAPGANVLQISTWADRIEGV